MSTLWYHCSFHYCQCLAACQTASFVIGQVVVSLASHHCPEDPKVSVWTKVVWLIFFEVKDGIKKANEQIAKSYAKEVASCLQVDRTTLGAILNILVPACFLRDFKAFCITWKVFSPCHWVVCTRALSRKVAQRTCERVNRTSAAMCAQMRCEFDWEKNSYSTPMHGRCGKWLLRQSSWLWFFRGWSNHLSVHRIHHLLYATIVLLLVFLRWVWWSWGVAVDPACC